MLEWEHFLGLSHLHSEAPKRLVHSCVFEKIGNGVRGKGDLRVKPEKDKYLIFLQSLWQSILS